MLNIKVLAMFLLMSPGKSSQQLCNKNTQKGPFMLNFPNSIDIKIEEIEIKALLYEYPSEVNIEIFNRWRYSHKCYTYWNYNQECFESLEEEIPTNEELKMWSSNSRCMVGKTCFYAGECWGSGAEECTKKYKSYEEIGENKQIEKDVPMKKRLYHTCIQKWRCIYNKGKTPLYVKSTNETGPIAFISNKNGDLIQITNKLYQGLEKIPNDDTFIKIKEDAIFPKIKEVKMGCYNSNKHISCYVTDVKGVENTPFIMNKDKLSGQMHNYGVIVTDPPEEFKCVDPKTQRELTWCQSHVADNKGTIIAKTPTVEDIMSIVETSSLNQMVTSSILKEISTRENTLQEISYQIVKSLSKFDPFLIGKIKNESIHTKWLNEDLFYTSECNKAVMQGNSNCNGRNIYKDGIYQPILKGDNCITEVKAPRNISILPGDKVSGIRQFTPLGLEASVGGWDVWEKYDTPPHESIERMTKIETKVSQIGDIVDISSFLFSSIYKWLRVFLDIVSVLNVLFLCCMMRRI